MSQYKWKVTKLSFCGHFYATYLADFPPELIINQMCTSIAKLSYLSIPISDNRIAENDKLTSKFGVLLLFNSFKSLIFFVILQISVRLLSQFAVCTCPRKLKCFTPVLVCLRCVCESISVRTDDCLPTCFFYAPNTVFLWGMFSRLRNPSVSSPLALCVLLNQLTGQLSFSDAWCVRGVCVCAYSRFQSNIV